MLDTAKNIVKHGVIQFLLRKEKPLRAGSMAHAQGLCPSYWGCGEDADGSLTVDGISVLDLANTYGTPLHVLNENHLTATYRQFFDSFRSVYSNVVLATSYKTNPIPHVLKVLHDAGSHAEVISHFELWLALELGVPAEKIILNGPGKGDTALQLAVERGIRMINVDGSGELEKIAGFARQCGVRQAIGLRVITSVGWSSQFGLSISTGAAKRAFESMRDYPELIPSGLHLHLGTGIQNIETYLQAVNEVIDFSEEIRADLDIEIDHFDFGGGFGVPTVRGITPWDSRMISLGYPSRIAHPETVPGIADYAAALKPVFARLKRNRQADAGDPTVVLEPGRAITSSGQMLLLAVVGKKPGTAGKTFVIVDGGKNVAMPVAWETHQIFAATKMSSGDLTKHDVFGPLCHPDDVIVKNYALPELEDGDLLAIMDAGAYFIPNQMNFSNPRPSVVSVRDGVHSAVRLRETFEDIIRNDHWPDRI